MMDSIEMDETKQLDPVAWENSLWDRVYYGENLTP